jgi:8-oxo-dGTP diphosphatase
MDSFGVVVFGKDGRVALRKPSNGYGGYVWTHAKGQPDKGETPAKTAMREAKEELGYKVRILEPLGVFNSSPDYQNFYFLGFALEGPFKTDWETEEVRWFTVDEARVALTLSAKVYGNKAGSRRDIRVFEAALKALHELTGEL